MTKGCVWVIGATGSGKSTLAARLSEETGLKVVEAGRFAREAWPEVGPEELGRRSADVLRSDFRFFSRRISAETLYPCIVAGVRNPVDLLDSLDAKDDLIYLLDAGTPPASDFEAKGLAAIGAVLDFFLATGVLADYQVERLQARKDGADWYDETHP